MIKSTRSQSSPVRFTSYCRRGVQVLVVAGELDLSTHDAWKVALNAALAAANIGLVIDLAHTEFCSIRCAEALLVAVHAAEGNRPRIAVVAPPRIVARVLDLLAPPEILPRYSTITEATAMLANENRQWGCA